jgi:hypothetical protein
MVRQHEPAGTFLWSIRQERPPLADQGVYQKLGASGAAFITCRQSKKSYGPVHSWTGEPQFWQEKLS